jgi:hypothetical protein
MADDQKTPEEIEAERVVAEKAAADAEAARKQADDDEAFDKDRAMHTIRTLRSELKDALKGSKLADDLKKRLDELEAKELSEQERAEKRAVDAEAKVAEAGEKLRRANLLVELAKPEHGIVNAAAAAKLIDGVEFNDDGEPTNIAAVLPAFLTENSFLKAPDDGGNKPAGGGTRINGGEGNQSGKTPALTADELEAAKSLNMTAEAYAAAKGKTDAGEIYKAVTATGKTT